MPVKSKKLSISQWYFDSPLAGCSTQSQTTGVDAPQKDDVWFKQAQEDIAKAKANMPIDKPAKNVILFVGDGMSVGTITAARIFLKGQRRGLMGEEYRLNMETMPNMALSKTYNTDAQTPDSAGTASAMVTGEKLSKVSSVLMTTLNDGFCNTVKATKRKQLGNGRWKRTVCWCCVHCTYHACNTCNRLCSLSWS